jgi:hypothetical protein
VRGKNKATIKYNSTVTYAYVDDDSGNNTTGTASSTEATAAVAPHLNIGEAIEDDPTVIKLDAGTHAAIGDISDTQRTAVEWVRVIPQDGLTAADVTVLLDATANSYRTDRLLYEGVTVKLTNTTSYLDGDANDNFLRFKNCIFDGSGVAKPTRPLSYRSNATYIENCTGDISVEEWNFVTSGVDSHALQFDGCDFGSTGTGAMTSWWRVMACIGGAGSWFSPPPLSNPGPVHENFLFEHNYFRNHQGAIISLSLGSLESITLGGSVIGNVIERLDTLSPCFWIKADSTALDCRHVLVANNIFTGNRCSILYADSGGATPYYCENNCIVGNTADVIGVKHDTVPSGTEDGRRVWSWGNGLYGGMWASNISAQHELLGGAADFLNEFIGLRSYQPAFVGTGQPRSGTGTAITFMEWVDRKSGDGGGVEAGNGDYRIHTASPAYKVMMGRILPYDQNGKPRSKSRDNAGAFAEGGVRPASMFFAQ